MRRSCLRIMAASAGVLLCLLLGGCGRWLAISDRQREALQDIERYKADPLGFEMMYGPPRHSGGR